MTREWIPVTEELPEKNGYYLVSRKIKYATSALKTVFSDTFMFCSRVVNIAEYVDKGWYLDYWSVDQKEDISRTVTAWMPVPRPYYDEVTKEL